MDVSHRASERTASQRMAARRIGGTRALRPWIVCECKRCLSGLAVAPILRYGTLDEIPPGYAQRILASIQARIICM
jgi:hypothetical protein